MPTLHAISYSPWSERARWALDHHKVAFDEVQFTPPFSEPVIRYKTGNWTRKVSAPTYIDGGESFTDSWDIAKHAEAIGTGEKLFPKEHEATILRLNELSQRSLDAARTVVLMNVLDNKEALTDLAPRKLGQLFGPLTPIMAKQVVKRTLRKWGGDKRSIDEALAICESALRDLQREVGGREFILGSFSYADITACQALGMVKPVTHPRLRIRSSTRARFTIESLAGKFDDLVEWRDALYAKHRTR